MPHLLLPHPHLFWAPATKTERACVFSLLLMHFAEFVLHAISLSSHKQGLHFQFAQFQHHATDSTLPWSQKHAWGWVGNCSSCDLLSFHQQIIRVQASIPDSCKCVPWKATDDDSKTWEMWAQFRLLASVLSVSVTGIWGVKQERQCVIWLPIFQIIWGDGMGEMWTKFVASAMFCAGHLLSAWWDGSKCEVFITHLFKEYPCVITEISTEAQFCPGLQNLPLAFQNKSGTQ